MAPALNFVGDAGAAALARLASLPRLRGRGYSRGTTLVEIKYGVSRR
jgi:hypothetical protein